ncbi:helix-turn-helix domain-containing protein [Sphingomonas sp.]|uniref:helix-turn-helix domain-containing protein n=1 Tax=Sphingomonas sp. TaxID=28214 RepID=UPI002D1FA3FB|nr:helix-turn-helix domain-containing protein [Sphingomonas sp.]
MSGEDEIFGETGSAPRVGERLRAAREAQGLTIEEIANSTRIPKRHLQTIEQGDYSGLPAPTYSAGFIKSWARRLGLDGQALSDDFRAEMGGMPSESTQILPYEPADPRRTPPAGLALLALLIAVVLGLGYLYWRGTAEQPAEIATVTSTQPAAPQPAPANPPAQAAPVAATPPAATAPQPTGPVVIGATQDVWMKIADSGKSLFYGVLHPGDHFEVPADAVAPLMTTGRPGHTTIMVGQTPIPPVGDPDRAAKDVSLKPADLLARVGAPPPAVQPPANATTPVENSAGT